MRVTNFQTKKEEKGNDEKFLDLAIRRRRIFRGKKWKARYLANIYFQRVDPDPMAIPRTLSFNKDASRDFALPPLARSPPIYRERESLECTRRIPRIFEALPPKRYSRIPRFNRP